MVGHSNEITTTELPDKEDFHLCSMGGLTVVYIARDI